MNLTLLGVLGYVAAQLAIGAYVSRRIRTEDDYLVAGRSLGYGLATFTIFATWFGAETCIGAAGAIYEGGLSGATADPFGYAACLLFLGLFFAVPLWRRKLTTLGDLFRLRYSSGVEKVAVVLMAPTSMIWAAAQIRAFGQVLSASSGLEVSVAITVAAAVVIVYTMLGGLLADAWTDLIQGILLIIGLAFVFFALMSDVGLEAYSAIDPARLNPFDTSQRTVMGIIEEWAIPICGSVVAAELVARVIASRSPEVARRSSLVASGMYFAVGLIPVSIGLIGFMVLPELTDPEHVLPLVAQQYLPGGLYFVFTGALISAILSTVDSALLTASSLISHNLIVPLRPGMTERQKVLTARVGVAAFGVLAFVLALHAEGVYALVEEASAFGSAGIFTVIVFGLFSRLGGVYSALTSLGTGIITWVLGAYVLEWPYPYLTSLGAAVLVYVAGAIAESRLQQVEAVRVSTASR